MKFLILAACVACAWADVSHLAPKSAEQGAQILKQDLDVNPDGQFQWSYETSNGISAAQSGQIVNPNAENPALAEQGQFAWTSPEGQPIQISYVADENGYQPSGDSLPTPPPIPDAIIRALKYIQEHPPAPERS